MKLSQWISCEETAVPQANTHTLVQIEKESSCYMAVQSGGAFILPGSYLPFAVTCQMLFTHLLGKSLKSSFRERV